MSIANEITRLNTAKANIKTAIGNKGITIGSSVKIDSYPTYINQIQTFDPYNGHDYVEIGGLKWATMNIGANSVTDYGQYFQWGDTTGFFSGSVGTSGTTYAKPFRWADYKLGNGRTSPGNSGMTKYNANDGKKVLDICDDAARADWCGSWRMPTLAELVALFAAANTALTTDYQGSGVSGLVLTDKTDSSKVLFFPGAGEANSGSIPNMGCGNYWTSSLYNSNRQNAYQLYFDFQSAFWENSYGYRFSGFSVRAVVG